MSKRKLGGAVPGEFDDDGPDTNVDERPEVVPSALEASEDTNVDEAPTIDPTTRRPPPRVRARPIKERNSRRVETPRSPAPPPEPPKKGRLKLPLPPGAAPRPEQSNAAPATPARPAVLDEPEPIAEAPRPRPASQKRKPVPTYAGEHKSAKWPFVLAIVLVATIGLAFYVGSQMKSAEEDPTAVIAAQQRRAVASAEQRGIAMPPPAAGANGAPSPVHDPSMPGRAAQPKTAVRKPAVPPGRNRGGVPMSTPPDAPSFHDVSDKGEDQPEYDEKDPVPTVPMLRIASKPPGIPAFIDGVPVGATPVVVPLPPDHKGGTIEFRKAGYVSEKKPYTVDGAGTYEVYQEVEADPTYTKKLNAALKKNPPKEAPPASR